MIEVSIARLGLDASSNAYVVVLQEHGGERLLPIWIGQPEAESIVMQIHNLKRVRPLTHDLCKNLIVGLGGQLQRVAITRVEQNTYFAELHVLRDGEIVTIDARPSDGIAIALRLDAPIFAADDLLSDIALEMTDGDDDDPADEPESGSDYSSPGASPGNAAPTDLSAEQLKSYLERLRPEDFGKFNP
ncbi:MAG: bifunctional nuclease family protein [Gemmatimonadaceae bacterium]|nr:bifunctional nuclease family protein [Gemmatimonadaceae bacterium]